MEEGFGNHEKKNKMQKALCERSIATVQQARPKEILEEPKSCRGWMNDQEQETILPQNRERVAIRPGRYPGFPRDMSMSEGGGQTEGGFRGEPLEREILEKRGGGKEKMQLVRLFFPCYEFQFKNREK